MAAESQQANSSSFTHILPHSGRFGPLDESLYTPSEEESTFYKSQTGIQSDEELKNHILAIQREAYEVYKYPCIRSFRFTKLWITKLPAYPLILELGRTRPGAIFVELGCCFGNDVRKLIADGYPMQNVVASDVEPAFWQLGHKLFKSDAHTFPVPLIAGDLFEAATLKPREPFYIDSPPSQPVPELKSLDSTNSLTPLQGHASAINISAVFHLFREAEKHAELARKVATLLSPLPGSLICGWHNLRGDLDGDEWVSPDPTESGNKWKDLWDGKVFKKGSVDVESTFMHRPDLNSYMMFWTVKRL